MGTYGRFELVFELLKGLTARYALFCVHRLNTLDSLIQEPIQSILAFHASGILDEHVDVPAGNLRGLNCSSLEKRDYQSLVHVHGIRGFVPP